MDKQETIEQGRKLLSSFADFGDGGGFYGLFPRLLIRHLSAC